MAIDTGINPSLGASNYSPFLQGATVGAQMQAQGAQNVAQGLSTLGAGIGKGLDIYTEQQKANKVLQGQIDSAVNQAQAIRDNAETVSPGLGKYIDGFLASASDPNASQYQKASLAQGFQKNLNEVLSLGVNAKIQRENVAIANAMQGGVGGVGNAINNGATFDQLNANNTGVPKTGVAALSAMLQSGVPADKAMAIAGGYAGLTKEDLMTASIPAMNNLNMQKILAGIELTKGKTAEAQSAASKNQAEVENTIPLQAAKTKTQINQINQNQLDNAVANINLNKSVIDTANQALSVAQEIKALVSPSNANESAAGGWLGAGLSKAGLFPLGKKSQLLNTKIQQLNTLLGTKAVEDLKKQSKNLANGARISPAVLDSLSKQLGVLDVSNDPSVNSKNVDGIISGIQNYLNKFQNDPRSQYKIGTHNKTGQQVIQFPDGRILAIPQQ